MAGSRDRELILRVAYGELPSVGTVHHLGVMHAIELLGTQVALVVWAEIARRTGGVS